jgi:predicted transposase YbfD/YdcC
MARSIVEYFAELPDPRKDKVKRHPLLVLLTIAILSVICGNDDFEAMEEFGISKRPWLQSFLDLDHGIPTADTFRRVFARLNPDAFEQCFIGWMKGLVGTLAGKLVAIDGKTLRGSFEHAWKADSAVQMVSAFVQENALVFAQVSVEEKGNEITAIPKLLELLDLQGATVSIDAIGCQKEIARRIKQGGGEYVLALKDNQETLFAKAKTLLDEAVLEASRGKEQRGGCGIILDQYEQTDSGHGRIEHRRVWITPEIEHLGEAAAGFTGLAGVAMVESTRAQIAGKTSQERRYYLFSHQEVTAERMARYIRGHWSVENNLHWVLDVQFHEDQSRVHAGHAAENLARARRIALNLLKREKTCRKGIATKRLKAGWDHQYLLKVLQM